MLRRLGEEVRIARMGAGLSLRELARLTSSSRSHLSRIERGEAPEISLRSLAVVFTVLGMQLSARPFPDGPPLRDVAHARLLSRFKARLHASIRMRTEVPLTSADCLPTESIQRPPPRGAAGAPPPPAIADTVSTLRAAAIVKLYLTNVVIITSLCSIQLQTITASKDTSDQEFPRRCRLCRHRCPCRYFRRCR